MDEYLGILLRVSIMYLYALAILRLSGKRSIAHLSVFDFVVANMIGDMFDDVFWAEVPLAQGLTGLTTVVLLHVLVAFVESRSDAVRRLVASEKTVVVRNSAFVEEGLAAERTSRMEVYAHLRLYEEDTLQEVREASWEPNGELSVLRKESSQEVKKQERKQLEELFQ